MNFDKLVSRLRLLVLVLPLFALTSTLHIGCSASSSGGYYGYGNPYGNPYGNNPYGAGGVGDGD